jgi:transcriptional regulator with XRE-family HTH domain
MSDQPGGRDRTEPHETGRAPAFAVEPLSPAQAAAVDLLAAGLSLTEVARRVGRRRSTVSAWANRTPVFRAAVAQAVADLRADAARRVRALRTAALDAIADSLRPGRPAAERLRAAELVLRTVEPVDAADAAEPTSAEEAVVAAMNRTASAVVAARCGVARLLPPEDRRVLAEQYGRPADEDPGPEGPEDPGPEGPEVPSGPAPRDGGPRAPGGCGSAGRADESQGDAGSARGRRRRRGR